MTSDRSAETWRASLQCWQGWGGKKTSERGRIFLLLLESAAHFIQRACDLLPATSPNGVGISRKERTSLSSSSTRVLEMPAAIENQLPSLTRPSRLDFFLLPLSYTYVRVGLAQPMLTSRGSSWITEISTP